MDDAERDEVRAGYEALCGAGGTALAERDLVVVQGPDTGRYLQGQLSQDVVTLAPGASTWSLLLQPTGKVDAWVRVHRLDDEDYAVDVDAGWGEAVVARLRRFLLRTKAEVADAERRLVLCLRHAPDRVAIGVGPEGVAAAEGALGGVVLGPGVAGIDRILPSGVTAADATADLDGPPVPAAALHRYRIAHGVPAMGAELTTDTIPAEGGSWLIEGSASFTKGCYTGQELVARIDSRGNTVPKPVRLVRLAGDVGGTPPLAAGVAVLVDGQAVGTLTSVAPELGAELPALGLGPVARAVPVGAEVTVSSGDARVAAQVVEAPVT